MSEQITMDGQYTYRNGEPARVLCVDAPGRWPVRSMDAEGRVHFHGANGEQIDIHSPTLVPIEPFRRGEVVMLKDAGRGSWAIGVFSHADGNLFHRFVGIERGKVCTMPYQQCRRPYPGELEEQS